MNPTQTYDELTAQLERLRCVRALLDQLDALGVSVDLVADEHPADEAELERLRLAAYHSMIQEHNAQNECS